MSETKEDFMCEECEADFSSKFNLERHMKNCHDKDGDESNEEDEEEGEEEEEDSVWRCMLTIVYGELISKKVHGHLTADDILESKKHTKEILDKLRIEMEYVIENAKGLEEDKLYQNFEKSKKKLEDDENYTTDEACNIAWKNRKLSMQELLHDNKDLLENELEGLEEKDERKED